MPPSPQPSAESSAAAFDVFISYSHTEAALAERLSRRIRRYRPPRALGMGRRRLTVFRDVERLTTQAELSDALRERIGGAHNLLLLCSPAAAQSKYVDQEVAAFVERKPRDVVHIVLAAGEPQAAFPPALKSAFQEPLYIDLRESGGWWRRWQRFRLESLRIIAALLRVDYATLYREDERRSRRQRWLAVSAVLATVATLGSTWLAREVPADTWAQVQVPAEHRGNKLLPIRDYAVNRQDPGIRVFRAFGAEYAAQRPVNPIALIRESAGQSWLQQFRDAAMQHLRRTSDLAGSWQPLARFRFTVAHDLAAVGGMNEGSRPVQWGTGQLYLYAFLPKPGEAPAFTWSLHYTGRNDAGIPVQVKLPPMAAAHDDPFDLQPWPASELIRAGALPQWGYLQGDLVTAWSPRPQRLVYRLIDAVESFQEANDGMWIESAVITDGDPRREVTVAGQRVAIDDIEPDAWGELTGDADWASPRAPKVERISNLYISRDDAGMIVVRDVGRQIVLAPALVELLEHDLAFEPELIHTVTHVARDDSGDALEMLTVVTRLFNEQTRIEEHQKTRYFLHRRAAGWSSLPGLTLPPGTAVIDLFALDASASRILVLTDRHGFHLTEDNGTTWRDFNHSVASLLNGTLVHAVVAGTPPSIYALVDQGDAKLANPLFRYVRRGWNERLRIGLVQVLLSGGGPIHPIEVTLTSPAGARLRQRPRFQPLV
jgi:hypothetical protein